MKTSAPLAEQFQRQPPISGNLATTYVDYYRCAKLDGKVALRFSSISKNDFKKTDRYRKKLRAFAGKMHFDDACRMGRRPLRYRFDVK